MIATVGFSPDKIIREGGSATMYRGFFRDLGTFAVKRFQLADWFRHQSISKFATMAYYLRHNNLVQLRGWCYEEEELVFVYEYLRNGNLDGILHNNTSSPIVLSWKHRLNIVLGVASALSYLHEECEEVLIHGDVRTSGIFLDEKFNAKLGDFGVAYIYKHCPVTFEKTGYSAPEYLDFGIPSVKTDVYSFGVVVLEVATGKKPIEDDGTMLVDWVRRLLYQGKLLQAADSKLEGKFDELEMERLLGVGIDCVHPHPQFRPKVREAVNILIGQATNPDGPDTNEGSWVSPSSHFSSGTSREI
ncbi:hypothetical protein JCGZ_25210 [Jatropha curcas]|uniref:Protein kinase domain-containing protein n=2 Tax=Jatropha curcas TaxID=180498 RepID=A0A067LFW8_JATCU|nr:hypothetical protein JCGZ_25210 [Jatropha curcas]